MMTSSNGNNFRVTGPVCGEFTGQWRGALMFSFICGWMKGWINNGRVRQGVQYVIIFQYVQFWIRLAAVSYRGKKVWTVVFPVVRSVKSRDTRNCVQKEPEYEICVFFATHILYKALWIILCALIWQITPQLQSSWRWQLWRYRSLQDVSAGHGRCHADDPWNFRNDVIGLGTKLFSVL